MLALYTVANSADPHKVRPGMETGHGGAAAVLMSAPGYCAADLARG